MKGSTASAPNHTERGIIYLDCVMLKIALSFLQRTQDREERAACIVMRFIIGGGGRRNPAIIINDSLKLF